MKFDMTVKRYNDKQIKKFVQKRCEDYKSDQGNMINSLMSKSQRRIIIDRLIYKENDQEILITDPNKIKELTNKHFQTCPGAINEEKEIPDPWKHQYEPQQHINDNIYKNLMDLPTLEEWVNIIKQLPNEKATGPSLISNEMLKHLGPVAQEFLWKFICKCISFNDIPDEWKEANVYPIPKPKEWECNLNNTHPITLLDTTRKALIRLFNNRLSTIFAKYKVLQGYQYAGLSGSSTFEPIRIINSIIEDAKEKQNEIWVLFQDLSKAYDRVNIFMLKKALYRLKLPTQFTNLIVNIFTNRTNRIFTDVGITDPYDLLVGIDQGEVISPLLWCIYYDPLLCEIQQRNLGYKVTHTYKNNIYTDETTTLESTVGDQAYMDDSTWFANNKESLEQILEIADQFFTLNNIKVNKEKSELLV